MCTQCVLGATYQSRPCGLDGRDRECAPCTNLAACPADTYKRSVCTLEENTDCYPCSKHPCSEGYFESAPCNATSDRVCSKCSDACPPGQFQSSECGRQEDIGCSPCSFAVCQDGFYLSTCSGRSDSVCKACSAPCVDGTTYESQPCTKLTNRVCKPCSVCTGNNYVLSKCQGADDTKCGLCRRGSNSKQDYAAAFDPMTLVASDAVLSKTLELCWKFTENYALVEDEVCKKNAWDEYWRNYPAFPRAMEQDANYKAWKSSKSQILDPAKPNYCVEFNDYTEGTCRDMEFESTRCRGLAPSVEDDPGKDFLLPLYTSSDLPWICPSNPRRWLVNFNAYHTCSLCRPPCNSPTSFFNPQYEISPCTGSSWNVQGRDRECASCKVSCPPTAEFPENYMLQACSTFQNAICRSDVVCTCPAGTYIAEACNLIPSVLRPASNSVCKPVTATCRDGFYKDADATPTSDTSCLPCPSSCPRGTYQRWPPAAGSKLARCPFECAECATCTVGKYMKEAEDACRGRSDTHCTTPCSECNIDTYKIGECQGTADTKCWPCRSAPSGTHIPPEKRCTRYRDSIPVPCRYHAGDVNRTCDAGQYMNSTCSGMKYEYIDVDVSSCRNCSRRYCQTGTRVRPCTGTKTYDDSGCSACPNLPSGRCRQGEFFSAECTCSKCAIQPERCTVYNGTSIYYNGCEGDGVVDNGGCDNKDFPCGEPCQAGYYQTVECNPRILQRRRCEKCSTPGTGYYVRAACTNVSQTDIGVCTPQRLCKPGVEYWVPCSPAQDGHCANCSTWPFTKPGVDMYYITGCKDGGTEDRGVAPKTPLSFRCPPGQYMRKGGRFENNECVDCRAPCVDGVEWQVNPCENNARRRCENCSKEECAPGMYESQSCSSLLPKQCSPCSFSGGCPPGSYMATDCTPKTDRTCRACTVQCPAGMYMVSQCNATHDAVCRNCSTRASLGCDRLPHATYVTACAGMFDSNCSRCSPPCERGKYFESRNCSGNHDRTCLACTQCLGNMYVAAPCGEFSDARCRRCDNGGCPDGKYESRSCKEVDRDNLHRNTCTDCAPRCDPDHPLNPTFEAIPCSGSSNSTVGTDRVCLPCTKECNATRGEEMWAQCSSNMDTICATNEEFYNKQLLELIMQRAACRNGVCAARSPTGPGE